MQPTIPADPILSGTTALPVGRSARVAPLAMLLSIVVGTPRPMLSIGIVLLARGRLITLSKSARETAQYAQKGRD